MIVYNVLRRAKQRFTNNSCNFKSNDGDIRDNLNLMHANVKIKMASNCGWSREHKYLSFFSFYVYTTCCLYRFVAIEILKGPTPCFQRKCLNIEKTRCSWTAWKIADHKSAIADKSERDRKKKTMHRDIKATSLSCQELDLHWKRRNVNETPAL